MSRASTPRRRKVFASSFLGYPARLAPAILGLSTTIHAGSIAEDQWSRKPLSEGEGVALLVLDLLDLIADADLDRPIKAVGLGGDCQPTLLECDLDRRLTESHGEREAVQPVVRLRAEVEGVVPDLGPHVAALDQVQRSGHHPHVDALLG